jgi:hypothetical protein
MGDTGAAVSPLSMEIGALQFAQLDIDIRHVPLELRLPPDQSDDCRYSRRGEHTEFCRRK